MALLSLHVKQLLVSSENAYNLEIGFPQFLIVEIGCLTEFTFSQHCRTRQTENEMLADQVKEKDVRISHLELAVSGKLIVQSAFPSQQQ